MATPESEQARVLWDARQGELVWDAATALAEHHGGSDDEWVEAWVPEATAVLKSVNVIDPDFKWESADG